MKKPPIAMMVIWLLLVLVVLVGIILVVVGQGDLAGFVSAEGTAIVMLGGLLYAGFDSKKRWPDKSYWDRMGKIPFFER